MVVRDGNVGVAFALTVVAGLSTALGAAIVFTPSLIKYATRSVLAAALGFAAGVMTYVSFAEIFGESVECFEEAGSEEDAAIIFATISFFGGVFMMMILGYMVDFFVGGGRRGEDEKVEFMSQQTITATSPPDSEDPRVSNCVPRFGENESSPSLDQLKDESLDDEEARNAALEETMKDRKLKRMGINTAIGLALHNFPEGIATFVATLADARVGATLAVAIIIHNIPEGLSVAAPIYYATGSKWKAFAWSALSGIAEPFAGFLAWLALANTLTYVTYAILFGAVAGIMVIISLHELLPTAHRYDPSNRVTTASFIFGMMVMLWPFR